MYAYIQMCVCARVSLCLLYMYMCFITTYT